MRIIDRLCVWLEMSVYWLFAVMIIDYFIKASLLLRRFTSRKWLKIDFESH